MEHQAPHEWPMRPQRAFEKNVNEMSSYELMETLEEWSEEVPVPAELNLQKLLDDMVEKFKEQHSYPPMEQTPSFPRPHIPYNSLYPIPVQTKARCSKCGMYLDQVMGYVCSDSKCPTFMTGVY
jgi:hypothetical protein